MHKSFLFRSVSGSIFGLICISVSGLAFADNHQFRATLSGAQEVVFDTEDNFVPGGTDTDASGTVTARFDRAFTVLQVNLRIRGLTGSLTGAHFHCGLPGENGPVAFGMVNPGELEFDGMRIRGTLTNDDFTGADCTEVVGRPVNNIVALAFAMRDGLIYANVHSDLFPAGEIRGQMVSLNDGPQ